jgi:hypothetical protein
MIARFGKWAKKKDRLLRNGLKHYLFFFVTILAQAFLPLVGGDFMAFFLLTARHSCLLTLDLEIDYTALKFAGEFESGNSAFRYGDFLVGLGVAANARFAGFETESAKTTNFDVMTLGQYILDSLEQGINYNGDVFADDTGVFRYFLYEISFCHVFSP